MIGLLIKFGLPLILGKFGLPTSLVPDIITGIELAKSAYNKIKADGGTEEQAVSAARHVLTSFREGPEHKNTVDDIKNQPHNV